MRTVLVIAALGAACATPKPSPGVPNAHAEGTFVHFAAADAIAATDAALSHTLAMGCSGPCDRVYVAIEPETSVEVLHRLVDAASAATTATAVYLVPAGGKAIELLTRDVECEVEVGVNEHGAHVVRAGVRLPPDPTCARWDAVICRADDGVYDWPRLRSEVGMLDDVCLAFATDTIADLPAIHGALRQPRVRLIRPTQAESQVPEASVTAVIKARGPDLQWCLDGEVAEELVPMHATLRLAVHTDGSVTRAEVVDGKRTTAQFERCIADLAEGFVFESPGTAAVVIEIPLAFEPGARNPRRIAAE